LIFLLSPLSLAGLKHCGAGAVQCEFDDPHPDSANTRHLIAASNNFGFAACTRPMEFLQAGWNQAESVTISHTLCARMQEIFQAVFDCRNAIAISTSIPESLYTTRRSGLIRIIQGVPPASIQLQHSPSCRHIANPL
jgi:hypothetical protein